MTSTNSDVGAERTPERIRTEIAALDQLEIDLKVQLAEAAKATWQFATERHPPDERAALEDLRVQIAEVLKNLPHLRRSLTRELRNR